MRGLDPRWQCRPLLIAMAGTRPAIATACQNETAADAFPLRGAAPLETAMAGKQTGQKQQRSGKQMGQKHQETGKQMQQEGNFGQDEARQQRDKETELCHMGDMAREDEHKNKTD
jgi:hypothetical protein